MELTSDETGSLKVTEDIVVFIFSLLFETVPFEQPVIPTTDDIIAKIIAVNFAFLLIIVIPPYIINLNITILEIEPRNYRATRLF